jgi:hypothetical protein
MCVGVKCSNMFGDAEGFGSSFSSEGLAWVGIVDGVILRLKMPSLSRSVGLRHSGAPDTFFGRHHSCGKFIQAAPF